MMNKRAVFTAAAVLMAMMPATAQAVAEPTASASSDGCKSRAAGSPTHVYVYEGKGALGFHMRERRTSPLKYGECLKTFGKTIEGHFSYHDDQGTTSDHSYYYKNPGGGYRYFYRVLTTSQHDFTKTELFVEDSELGHCPSAKCQELAAYDPQ
ncbi:hypothetical protein ACFV3R_34455 [Streptomyces sp. NPDC059740]|uniref:hypothetical protein n=1 Tax=Streptomyces sp. NPDC059740 TaxID=3346926 RepID=UPI00365707CF